MTGYNAEDLDDTVAILIDDVSKKVKLHKISNNSSIFIGGMHGGGISSFNISRVCNLTGKFVIPPENESLLLGSKLFMLRVSTGGKYTVLKATDGQLGNIKKLLSVDVQ